MSHPGNKTRLETNNSEVLTTYGVFCHDTKQKCYDHLLSIRCGLADCVKSDIQSGKIDIISSKDCKAVVIHNASGNVVSDYSTTDGVWLLI